MTGSANIKNAQDTLERASYLRDGKVLHMDNGKVGGYLKTTCCIHIRPQGTLDAMEEARVTISLALKEKLSRTSLQFVSYTVH